jgi:ATP-binding cassette subfamily B protein RtxB
MNKSLLTESVSGVETIRSMAVEPRMLHCWEAQTAGSVEAGSRSGR